MSVAGLNAVFSTEGPGVVWQRLDDLCRTAGALRGWRRYGAAFLLGIVSSLALPPVFAFPVLWATLPLLVWMLDGAKRKRQFFLIGWCFGFGLYAASLYWISNALLVFSDRFWWMVPFAALGLPAVLAIYAGLAGLVSRLAAPGPARAFAFAAAWVLGEWLRGHLLTGFPWNLLGHAWTGTDVMSQAAAWIGVYGLSALALASAVLPALAAGAGVRKPSPVRRQAAIALAVALPVAIAASGAFRLSQAPALGIADVPGVGLRLVQANIPQRQKWQRDLRGQNFYRHLELSEKDRPDWVTHLIWPETAAAFFLEEDAPARDAAAQVIPAGGHLITGAPRRVTDPFSLHNSVVVLDARGAVAATYDKAHLVPFGEYAPFRSVIGIDKITAGSIDYTPGPGPRTLALAGLPSFSPLVCYEAIFPGAVVSGTDPRPAWLLNLTNDAWYGKTAGPHQHLTMARMRAVEEGLPLVRATNTGVSAAFDSFGREIGRIPLEQPGVLDIRLPRALSPTLYAKIGDAAFLCLLLWLAGTAVWLHRGVSRSDTA
ncbi:apolipoprotein N-acyltransferase [Hwanghaeella sp.]|uniref:apolipoprotein N-acyltransferase n=1 Tax=Hwanghaeella sp. TaxID=2605943 RepID=UPI003CCB909C